MKIVYETSAYRYVVWKILFQENDWLLILNININNNFSRKEFLLYDV